MILSRNYEDIDSIFDFHEGIISNICWNYNFTDLLMTVYYFYDIPQGLKDKDVIIRFKNCSTFNYECGNMLNSIKEFNIITPHPEIERISLKKNNSYINVEISTNYAAPMLSLLCDEIWIEFSNE